MEEQQDELITELSSFMEEKQFTANAASAPTPAPAAAAAVSPFRPIPSIPSGFARSFATAARTPAIRMRSPISRTPMVPNSVITREGNRKRAAFALHNGEGALRVLESFGMEALLANSHLLTEDETVCDELNDRIQEASASGDKSLQSLPANPPLTLGPVGSSPRFGSQPLSELNPSDVASPVVCHPAADAPSTSGRPNFKVNLPQPPRFGTISTDSDISSWLYKVGKVCRLSGYPKSGWSTFASTLLENTPQTLFDTAETEARKTTPQALENFLDWDNFTKWCELNLNLGNHSAQAKIAMSNLKQVSTVSVYRAAFDFLASRADNEGMHIFWWYQGLKPFIATASALDPHTNAEYTDLADAQNAAVAVENIRMPGPAATSNLDGNRTFQQHKKGQVWSSGSAITTADPPCGCQQVDQGHCPLHPVLHRVQGLAL